MPGFPTSSLEQPEANCHDGYDDTGAGDEACHLKFPPNFDLDFPLVYGPEPQRVTLPVYGEDKSPAISAKVSQPAWTAPTECVSEPNSNISGSAALTKNFIAPESFEHNSCPHPFVAHESAFLSADFYGDEVYDSNLICPPPGTPGCPDVSPVCVDYITGFDASENRVQIHRQDAVDAWHEATLQSTVINAPDLQSLNFYGSEPTRASLNFGALNGPPLCFANDAGTHPTHPYNAPEIEHGEVYSGDFGGGASYEQTCLQRLEGSGTFGTSAMSAPQWAVEASHSGVDESRRFKRFPTTSTDTYSSVSSERTDFCSASASAVPASTDIAFDCACSDGLCTETIPTAATFSPTTALSASFAPPITFPRPFPFFPDFSNFSNIPHPPNFPNFAAPLVHPTLDPPTTEPLSTTLWGSSVCGVESRGRHLPYRPDKEAESSPTTKRDLIDGQPLTLERLKAKGCLNLIPKREEKDRQRDKDLRDLNSFARAIAEGAARSAEQRLNPAYTDCNDYRSNDKNKSFLNPFSGPSLGNGRPQTATIDPAIGAGAFSEISEMSEISERSGRSGRSGRNGTNGMSGLGEIDGGSFPDNSLTAQLVRENYDLRLGENGRSKLKREISMQMRQDPSLRLDIVNSGVRVKNANVVKLVRMAECAQCLLSALKICRSYWRDRKGVTDVADAGLVNETTDELTLQLDLDLEPEPEPESAGCRSEPGRETESGNGCEGGAKGGLESTTSEAFTSDAAEQELSERMYSGAREGNNKHRGNLGGQTRGDEYCLPDETIGRPGTALGLRSEATDLSSREAEGGGHDLHTNTQQEPHAQGTPFSSMALATPPIQPPSRPIQPDQSTPFVTYSYTEILPDLGGAFSKGVDGINQADFGFGSEVLTTVSEFPIFSVPDSVPFPPLSSFWSLPHPPPFLPPFPCFSPTSFPFPSLSPFSDSPNFPESYPLICEGPNSDPCQTMRGSGFPTGSEHTKAHLPRPPLPLTFFPARSVDGRPRYARLGWTYSFSDFDSISDFDSFSDPDSFSDFDSISDSDSEQLTDPLRGQSRGSYSSSPRSLFFPQQRARGGREKKRSASAQGAACLTSEESSNSEDPESHAEIQTHEHESWTHDDSNHSESYRSAPPGSWDVDMFAMPALMTELESEDQAWILRARWQERRSEPPTEAEAVVSDAGVDMVREFAPIDCKEEPKIGPQAGKGSGATGGFAKACEKGLRSALRNEVRVLHTRTHQMVFDCLDANQNPRVRKRARLESAISDSINLDDREVADCTLYHLEDEPSSHIGHLVFPLLPVNTEASAAEASSVWVSGAADASPRTERASQETSEGTAFEGRAFKGISERISEGAAHVKKDSMGEEENSKVDSIVDSIGDSIVDPPSAEPSDGIATTSRDRGHTDSHTRRAGAETETETDMATDRITTMELTTSDLASETTSENCFPSCIPFEAEEEDEMGCPTAVGAAGTAGTDGFTGIQNGPVNGLANGARKTLSSIKVGHSSKRSYVSANPVGEDECEQRHTKSRGTVEASPHFFASVENLIHNVCTRSLCHTLPTRPPAARAPRGPPKRGTEVAPLSEMAEDAGVSGVQVTAVTLSPYGKKSLPLKKTLNDEEEDPESGRLYSGSGTTEDTASSEEQLFSSNPSTEKFCNASFEEGVFVREAKVVHGSTAYTMMLRVVGS